MTETLTRPRGRTTRQDWRGHVLALVLFAVLVWYTFVSPSYTAAPLHVTGDDAPDAEEREAGARAAVGFPGSGVARAAAARPDESDAGDGADELDWPEIIGNDER